MPRPSTAHAALLVLIACWLATALPAKAANEQYVLDPVHTRVLFAIEHAGFSDALGTVSGSTGQLEFDPDDWTGATLEVNVPLQRLDLGDAKWNRATLARNLLDAGRHPSARFVSTRVEPLGENRACVVGMLTLRGVTREVKLDVVFNALKRYPLPPFRRTVGFSATATISRSDFGITAWKSLIGDQVELRIEVEAVRGRLDEASAVDPVAGDDAADGDSMQEPPQADSAIPDLPDFSELPDLPVEPEPTP